jgi:condensation domain-containing protein
MGTPEPTSTADAETLHYKGDRAVSGPLINGQRIMWRIMSEMDWQNAHITLPVDLPVPAGRGIAEVLDAVRTLIERHEVLRTIYPTGIDGRPVQHVLESGTLPVRYLRTTAPDPARSTATAAKPVPATALSTALRADPIGPTDLPIRVGIGLDGDTPHTVALAVSHLAVDGWSRGIVIEELAALLAGADLPPVLEQPVDRAAYEASDAGRSVQRRALRHWRTTLMLLPEAYYAPAGDFEEHADSATLTSPAAARALARIAARLGVSRSTGMAAAVSLAIGLRQPNPCGALWFIVTTRFRAASARLVAAFNQNALMYPDWTADTHAAFTRGVARRMLQAYRTSEYQDEAQLALLAELAAEHGGNPPRSWYYNDVSPLLSGDAATVGDGDVDLDELRTRSVLVRTDEHLGQAGHQMFCIVRSTAGPAAVIGVTVDRRAVPSGGAARLLLDVETILVAGAAGDRTLDQLREALAGHDDWQQILSK